MYNDEVPPLYAFGWVDEGSQQVITPFAIPGGTSFLATGAWDTEYAGLNSLAETEKYGEMNVADMPVNMVFQSVSPDGCDVRPHYAHRDSCDCVLDAWWAHCHHALAAEAPLSYLLCSGFLPFRLVGLPLKSADSHGWCYPSTSGPDGVSLLTNNAISQAVSAPEARRSRWRCSRWCMCSCSLVGCV